MNSKNTLFYSKKCKTCQILINILKNENLIHHFNPFCVDGKINQIPPQITVVPTMIVKDINKILVGEETFKWVDRVKFLKKNKKIVSDNESTSDNLDGPKPFSELEHGNNISDSYAYKSKKIDIAMPHSYFEVGTENQNEIYTAPWDKNASKIDKNKQIEHIEKIVKLREKQDFDHKINLDKKVKNVLNIS